MAIAPHNVPVAVSILLPSFKLNEIRIFEYRPSAEHFELNNRLIRTRLTLT